MPLVPAVTQPFGVGHGIQEPFTPANPATGANFLKPWFFIYVDHGRVSSFYFALKFVD